eukprot:5770602-Amphidinium_carterae.1
MQRWGACGLQSGTTASLPTCKHGVKYAERRLLQARSLIEDHFNIDEVWLPSNGYTRACLNLDDVCVGAVSYLRAW